MTEWPTGSVEHGRFLDEYVAARYFAQIILERLKENHRPRRSG